MTIPQSGSEKTSTSHFKFSTVPGYFLQDEESTDPSTFDYATSNFGLVTRPYDTDSVFDPERQKTQWERLAHQVRTLNQSSDESVSYKLLFLGRHGEGNHNVAERRYGTAAWDCYWSLLDGDETGNWVDARLNEVGIAQAQLAHETWKQQMKTKIPAPEMYYVSPLNRCLATAAITFRGLKLPGIEPFRPLVKELIRETTGLHTCDKRSSRSAIEKEYPEYIIEPGFSEEDPLYDPNTRESNSGRSARLREFLFDVFANDESVFVSFTAHSGCISSILEVVGHREFMLATGAVIPVLVRAEKVAGPPPEMVVEPPMRAPKCVEDPKVGTVEVLAEAR